MVSSWKSAFLAGSSVLSLSCTTFGSDFAIEKRETMNPFSAVTANFTPVLFVVAIACGMLLLAILERKQRRKFAASAIHLNELYKGSQKAVALRNPTDQELRDCQGDDAVQSWESECRDLGLAFVAHKIEEHQGAIALHSIWFSEAIRAFVFRFSSLGPPARSGRAILGKTPEGHIHGLSDFKGMGIVVAGAYTPSVCPRGTSVQTMIATFGSLPGFDPDLLQDASYRGLEDLRSDLQRIKERIFEDHEGIIPYELLESLSSNKSPAFLRAVHDEIRKRARATGS